MVTRSPATLSSRCRRLLALLLVTGAAAACAPPLEAAPPLETTRSGERWFLDGRRPGGQRIDLLVRDGLIVDIRETGEDPPASRDDEATAPPSGSSGLATVDLGGAFLAPAFIDSHVHLAYLPAADAMADGGVAAAVDLAAPMEFFEGRPSQPQLILAGPILTAPAGYPTQGWGRGGFGHECDDVDAVTDAIDALVERGAGVVKMAVMGSQGLDSRQLAAGAARAGHHGIHSVAHALSAETARLAAEAGVEVLAHTPLERMTAEDAQRWSQGAVISTLSAFGASAGAIANLESLREAGATVLYGTDFGNSRTAGIDGREIELLMAAGLDGAEILEAGTRVPADFWGLRDLGRLEVGRRASFLVLAGDPHDDPRLIARPRSVWIDGEQRRPE